VTRFPSVIVRPARPATARGYNVYEIALARAEEAGTDDLSLPTSAN